MLNSQDSKSEELLLEGGFQYSSTLVEVKENMHHYRGKW
jgi:hypothetical protein